jgi:hypothetical protein
MSELPEQLLEQLKPVRKKGNESLTVGDAPAGPTLLDFWQWSASDLVSNTTRGRLAEFIVASALGLATDVRLEWDAFDLLNASGLRIEVKSCAYLQSWFQKKPTPIYFQIPPTRAWDAATNKRAIESRRQADVYVFAILAHEKKSTLDPLDLDQWHFYPVLTRDLDSRPRNQHSITLKSLQNICAKHVSYSDLAKAISELESRLKGS